MRSKQSCVSDGWGHWEKAAEPYPKLPSKHQNSTEYSGLFKKGDVLGIINNLVLLAGDLNSGDYFIAVVLNCCAGRAFKSPLLH